MKIRWIIFGLLAGVLLPCGEGWSAISRSSGPSYLNFGTYVQTSSSGGSIAMSTAGICTPTGFKTMGGTCAVSTVTFSDSYFWGQRLNKNITFTPDEEATLSPPEGTSDCTVKVNNVTLSDGNNSGTEFQETAADSYTFYIAATATLSGLCEAGTYTGTLSINYVANEFFFVNGGKGTLSVNVTLTLESSLSVTEKQELNFGSILQSTSGGTVTLDPAEGAASYSGVSRAGSDTAQTGIFEVKGLGGQTVNCAVPSRPTQRQFPTAAARL